jgi:hypothetical protein
MDFGSEIRDPGSGKNLFRIPDPGSKGQKGTGSGIRIRNTADMYLSNPDTFLPRNIIITPHNIIMMQMLLQE